MPSRSSWFRAAHTPVRSIWATAGAQVSSISRTPIAARVEIFAFVMIGSPSGRAWGRVPLRSVRLALERRAGLVRLLQISGIDNRRHDDQPVRAVGLLEEVPVLRHRRRRTVGHTIPAQIPGAQ